MMAISRSHSRGFVDSTSCWLRSVCSGLFRLKARRNYLSWQSPFSSDKMSFSCRRLVIQSADFLLGASLRAHTRPFHVSARRSVLYKNANTDVSHSSENFLPSYIDWGAVSKTFLKAIAQKDRIAVVDFNAEYITSPSPLGMLRLTPALI